MKPQLTLEQQLERSVHHARAKRLAATESDISEWLAAIPEPEKEAKMTNAIELAEHRNGGAVVVHQEPAQLEFTPQQRAMIRDTYANGASEKEFQVLLEVAKLRRLNPLLRQIHFVKRWNGQLKRDVWAAQVSVDGLRAIAERTNKYDGQDEAEFGPIVDGFPEWARVKVYRKDWQRPAVGTAYWSEYVQTTREGGPTRFWQTMPRVMLSKCAEAIAMRKAFPEDMGGLYTDEEMQQTENDRPAQLSPHRGPGETEIGIEDQDAAAHMLSTLEMIKADCATCDSYDKALALRALLGTRAKQSALTREIQLSSERGDINSATKAALGKLWMHCDRQVTKLEKQLAPGPEDALVGDDDGTEALGAPERQPGEDDD